MIAFGIRGTRKTREDVTDDDDLVRTSLDLRDALRHWHCNTALIAPEWTEERNERQIHVWRCWRCDFYFETIHTKVMRGSSTDDTLPPRLVA